ncbi:hypothetical protein SLEP1_g34158 [Rubroshorea leprosula]|uniref:Uncharacterized protein n=1 Tax=Rubroshorea leprosula TaxID=152421 RepID=A0AAV5KJ48_9ROSI|nr:hypothetical protein SLEP1_g34158 [Rubroshorea leprosula]
MARDIMQLSICKRSSSVKSSRMRVMIKKVVAMEKKLSKLRAGKNRAKENLEKYMAVVKEKEIKCAKSRKLIELLSKENECIQHFLDLAVPIIDAEDNGDFAGVELLKQSSELLAKQIDEIQAEIMNGQLE